MLGAAQEARAFIDGRSRSDLDTDRKLLLALFSGLSMIGEAANHVTADGRAALPRVPWPAVIGMRHRVVHGYFDIDNQQVWDTVHDDLPSLIEELERFLRSAGHLGQ
jgi:uncharacterized protein with HEPN domain